MKFSEAYTDHAYILSTDRRETIKFKEPKEKREYIADNIHKRHVVRYKVDDGIITSKALQKCDFALYVEDDRVYFIEMKGSDYDHAIDQIDSTITILLEKPQLTAASINARVVLSKARTPNMKTIREKKLNARLKKLNGTLVKRTGKLIETID